MAVPTNTFSSFSAIGNREDLTDAIFNIDPIDTPFGSSIARSKATGVLHEHQTDALEAAANIGYIEGDDATADTATPTERLTNPTQIFRKVVSVSRTQRTTLSAGRRDEYAYQLAKRGKELKRNIETALLSARGRSAGSVSAARYLGGVETWLTKANGSVHLATTATTPGLGVTVVDGTVVSTTAADLKVQVDAVIGNLWTNGSDANVIMAGVTGKKKLSEMSGIATLYREVPKGNEGNIIGGADLYVSNFGEYVIVPNRFSRDQTVLLLDYDYWAIAELDAIQVIPLAKTGDSDRAFIVCELTLECRNPKASAKIADFAA